MDFIIGVDLGQAQDFTAITVLEVHAVPTGETRRLPNRKSRIRTGSTYFPGEQDYGRPPPSHIDVPVTVNHYQARHLERMPLQTSYPAQVERVREIFNSLVKDDHKPSLVVDQTGVGRPVIDMLRAAKLPVKRCDHHRGRYGEP